MEVNLMRMACEDEGNGGNKVFLESLSLRFEL